MHLSKTCGVAATLICLSACGASYLARVPDVVAVKGDAEAGAALFASTCSGCHGKDGARIKRHDLTSDKVRSKTPAKLAAFILDGEDDMPAFGDRLSDAQVANLIAWIRRPAAAPSSNAPAATNDPAATDAPTSDAPAGDDSDEG
jgi:mono/diheme cytochrome c family protein